MTLPIERARSRRPITWLTLLGVLLLPALIGGILVIALQNPTDRLESMSAAVVNLDKPVTIDGQYTPLGRQLASGLVKGSDDADSNLTWVISNEKDAAEGLGDGTYQAVVTIPKSFSADATSAATALKDGDDSAQQAKITVTTPPDGRVADDLITNQIANVAASTTGTMLSEATIGNVLVSFTTIGDQLGDAADGATKLADGARSAADGAAELPGGATKLADGATQLGSGAYGLAGGANGLSSGATQLSDGASKLAGGATQLGSGLDTIAAKTREAGAGATQLGQGLASGAAALSDPKGDLHQLAGAAAVTASKAQDAATRVSTSAEKIGALAQECMASGASAEFCGSLGAQASALGDAVRPAMESSGYAAKVSEGVSALPDQLSTQLRTAGTAASALGTGLGQLAAGVDQSAAGARDLGTGATGLGTGAAKLGTGASQLADGANQIGAGATALGDGATALADGAGTLAEGIDTLASGTGDLADGLKTASTSLPSFDEQQSTKLASVIANPVKASADNAMFGPTAIPLLAAVVLWFGALASFIALRAVPGNALTSRRSSFGMVLRGFWPAAALGAGQGLLVALIVQIVASYDAATWWGFAGFAVLAGIAFAAVNQALVTVLGGIGRWISVLVGVLAVATGLISTIPAWLAGLGAAMPTAPALGGMIAPNGSAFAGLVVWAVLSMVVATLAVTTRRTTSAKAVLATA